MSITQLGLLMREEPLRHDEVQLVLGSGHRHVKKPTTGAGLISGQWGSYKTTVALDIAVSVMA